jgi:hypothetical protein
MSKKIIDLAERRKKKHPQTLEEFGRDAIKYIFDPARLDGLEEPVQLASGKTTPTGSFVPEGDDEVADEENHED